MADIKMADVEKAQINYIKSMAKTNMESRAIMVNLLFFFGFKSILRLDDLKIYNDDIEKLYIKESNNDISVLNKLINERFDKLIDEKRNKGIDCSYLEY